MRSAAFASALLGAAALAVALVAPASATAAPAAHTVAAAHHNFYISRPQHTNGQHPFVGGQHQGGFNQDGGNWSGYVATGSGFTSASSGWTEPSVTCNSSNDLMAPWVGIDGYGSSSVEQTGVATDCSSGSPVYQAWYEMYPAAPVYYNNPVSAGDSISASATTDGSGNYTLKITDNTQGWTQTTPASYQGSNASAEAIIESPTAAYPNFGSVNFTGFQINGQDPSSFSPVALDASNSNGFEDHTGSLSGGNFSITYAQE
jgi:hypothetical protein